jgi:cytochrome oxidase assembly protein ShyY1
LSSKEPYALLKSIIALLLVCLCLVAANWQYHRGVNRHALNFKIQSNSNLPATSLATINPLDIKNEWRIVRIKGTFDTSHEVLLRNHYNADGKYGFEYLTLFKSKNETFWVDRGWVKAGESALARPDIPATPSSEIEILGRLRLDTSLPTGSFFALPKSGALISDWNLQSKIKTSDFYLDLISAPGANPQTPAELPELSDGPHMAYALQWLFFAALIIYGRYLIRKR